MFMRHVYSVRIRTKVGPHAQSNGTYGLPSAIPLISANAFYGLKSNSPPVISTEVGCADGSKIIRYEHRIRVQSMQSRTGTAHQSVKTYARSP
jgi:hypothetical protein